MRRREKSTEIGVEREEYIYDSNKSYKNMFVYNLKLII